MGGPRVRVLVGAERHPAVDLPLRFLGLGEPDVVPVDERGRIRADALGEALALATGPTIVSLQAGNIHSGDFDPFAECIAVAHEHGAWVHVDGAFGLWAAASPRWADDVRGLADADSWATDAHKTLNVPYDCGLAIVRDRDALASSMAMHGEYLIEATGDPQERVPELSRRARGFASWAALRSLGRSGVVAMVEGLAARARDFAEGAAEIEGVEVLNDVVFTQVCLSFGDDDRTRAVAAALLADGTTWMSGSRWHDRAIVRISVSNWSTTEDDVRRSLDALRRAAAGVWRETRLTEPMSSELLRPAKASPGDRVAVLSPSFAAPAVGPAVHEQALRRLQEVTGLVPVEYPTTRRLNATAVDRAADLNAAFGDPEIRAVLATIGGDDQITVIPHLDPALVRRDPKPFLGYSDNTNLLSWLWCHGVASFHGGSTQVHARPGPGRRRDPPGVAARRAAGRGTAGDHRAGRVGGHRAAVGRPGRAHVVRRAGAHRALDVGRSGPVGHRPDLGRLHRRAPVDPHRRTLPGRPPCARRRRAAPRGLGGPDPGVGVRLHPALPG